MVYQKIQVLCAESKTTITKLERDCGLANATIRRWASSSPSAENLGKVADYFGVAVDYLLDRGAYALSDDAVRCARLFDSLSNEKKQLALAYVGGRLNDGDKKLDAENTAPKSKQLVG